MAVILQSKCYQMSNQVPNLPVSIDVRLMNIKTVSKLSFFSRSVLWVYSMHCTPDQRNKFQGSCKWTSHKMGTFSSKYYGDNTKLHEKLSNAAGLEINHLIIMQWFNHMIVYCITIINVLCERFSPFHNGQWLVWFVVMNKAYNNKHDVFCSFSLLLNVVNVKWVNEWMNISEKFAWSLNVLVCLKVALI